MRRNSKLFRILSIVVLAIFLSEMPIMANPDMLGRANLVSRQALLAPKTTMASSPEPAAEIGSSENSQAEAQEGSTQQEARLLRRGR